MVKIRNYVLLAEHRIKMLKVKTYLDKSSIEGLGVFAAEDISKGTITWEYNPTIDKDISGFAADKIEFEFIEKYAFQDKQLDIWILSSDNDRFTNHSDSPNTGPLPDGTMIALRDIKNGEEITSRYYDIDWDWTTKLVKPKEN